MYDVKVSRTLDLAESERKIIELTEQLQQSIPVDGLDNMGSKAFDHFVSVKLELRNAAFLYYQKARYDGDWCYKGLHYLSLAYQLEHRRAMRIITDALKTNSNESVCTNLPKGIDHYEYYLIALSYLTGLGNPQNLKMARKALNLAATMGCAEAQYLLGLCYKEGYGVTKYQRKAFNLFLQAAERGNKFAQCELGDCYYDGRGCFQNFNKGFSWQVKAAKYGHAKAQCWLGSHYRFGEGCSKSYKNAFKWLLKAAKQKNGEAQNDLGVLYHYGQGVDKNEQQASRMYRLAYRNGSRFGLSNLRKGSDDDYYNYHLAMIKKDVNKVIKLLLDNRALKEEFTWDKGRAKEDRELQALINKVDKHLTEACSNAHKNANTSGKASQVGIFSQSIGILCTNSSFHVQIQVS